MEQGNNYYSLRILPSSGISWMTSVYADGWSSYEAGYYSFWIKGQDGNRNTIACYPISKTIIEKIEENKK